MPCSKIVIWLHDTNGALHDAHKVIINLRLYVIGTNIVKGQPTLNGTTAVTRAWHLTEYSYAYNKWNTVQKRYSWLEEDALQLGKLIE